MVWPRKSVLVTGGEARVERQEWGALDRYQSGWFFLSLMAGVTELEHNLIAERTATALAHKKADREAYAPTP